MRASYTWRCGKCGESGQANNEHHMVALSVAHIAQAHPDHFRDAFHREPTPDMIESLQFAAKVMRNSDRWWNSTTFIRGLWYFGLAVTLANFAWWAWNLIGASLNRKLEWFVVAGAITTTICLWGFAGTKPPARDKDHDDTN